MAPSDKKSTGQDSVSRIRAFQKSVPANKKCANCKEQGPTYICLDFHTFVCQVCSGIHREFGHKVKSISLSDWAQWEVQRIEQGGNEKAATTMLVGAPDPATGPRMDRREFIRKAYVEKQWWQASSAGGAQTETTVEGIPPKKAMEAGAVYQVNSNTGQQQAAVQGQSQPQAAAPQAVMQQGVAPFVVPYTPPSFVVIEKNHAFFCPDHDSSEKRQKQEAALKACNSCHTPMMTTYCGFVFCPQCSARLQKCMICGNCKADEVAPSAPPAQPSVVADAEAEASVSAQTPAVDDEFDPSVPSKPAAADSDLLSLSFENEEPSTSEGGATSSTTTTFAPAEQEQTGSLEAEFPGFDFPAPEPAPQPADSLPSAQSPSHDVSREQAREEPVVASSDVVDASGVAEAGEITVAEKGLPEESSLGGLDSLASCFEASDGASDSTKEESSGSEDFIKAAEIKWNSEENLLPPTCGLDDASTRHPSGNSLEGLGALDLESLGDIFSAPTNQGDTSSQGGAKDVPALNLFPNEPSKDELLQRAFAASPPQNAPGAGGYPFSTQVAGAGTAQMPVMTPQQLSNMDPQQLLQMQSFISQALQQRSHQVPPTPGRHSLNPLDTVQPEETPAKQQPELRSGAGEFGDLIFAFNKKNPINGF